MTSAQREFLVQRLMEDSQKMRKSTGVGNMPKIPMANSSDSEEHSDSSSSDQDPTSRLLNSLDGEQSSATLLAGEINRGITDTDMAARLAAARSSIFGAATVAANPLQYAATLMSLAQMNFLPPNAIPFLYPNLCQNLMGIPQSDRLRNFYQQQSPQSPSELLSRLVSGVNVKSAPGSVEKFPDSSSFDKNGNPTLAVTPKNLQNQSTPSPRKRSSQAAKNVDPKKGDPLNPSDFGNVETPKKPRAIRKIQFDDEKSSPVSGMYIKDMPEFENELCNNNHDSDTVVCGRDNVVTTARQQEMLLHESADFVKVTEEAKKELAKIPNVIGDYVCQLCKLKYEDAFRLAMHKCPRIGHKIYRCPECDKVFSCPANLASHRRWHRPKEEQTPTKKPTCSDNNNAYNFFKNALQQQQQFTTALQSEISTLNSPTSSMIDDIGAGDPLDLSGKMAPMFDKRAQDETSQDKTAQVVDFSVFSENGTSAYYQCDICDKKFETHRLLRSHAVNHTNFVNRDNAAEEIPCHSCNLWFLSPDARDKHERQRHAKFLCKFCNETFPTSPALTRHINKRHVINGECRATAFVQEFLMANDDQSRSAVVDQ